VDLAFAHGTLPFEVGPYSVRLGSGLARAPAVGDGFITHMEADVVDVRSGREVPIERIMLHHERTFTKAGT